MMYTNYNCENLRNKMIYVIEKVFENLDNFFDFIDFSKSGIRFEVIKTYDEEFYIIDRDTGYLVNWYKYTHIGRDAHINFNPEELEEFFTNFKNSEEKED